MNQVLRSEKKYLCSRVEFMQADTYFSGILHGDLHNGLHGYPVRSLYFDTVYDSDFFNKAAGIELRKIIRLRVYNPSADFAMLEIKQKQGSRQLKRSLKISKDAALRLIEGHPEFLLDLSSPFAQECYELFRTQCYFPKTIVQYDRKAFVASENSTRITFDHHIAATESSFDLFSEKLNLNPVIDETAVVMEVKFNGFLLSYIKDIVSSVNKSELSVSKYVLARQNAYLTHL